MSSPSLPAAGRTPEEVGPTLAHRPRARADAARAPVRAVHQLFEMQAGRSPDAVALALGGQRVTFRQLDACANQVANRLRSLGVSPEARVGLCVERSLEMVVGLLGILKAGGVLVSLDPHYPRERLAYLTEDAGLNVLLTQSHLAGDLPASTPPTLCLDSAVAELDCESAADPEVELHADHAAYVIYTSGSTGRPKGVVIPHGALLSHCVAVRRLYGLAPSDRVLQFASLSFDAALEQILPPLAAGARVVLQDPVPWSPAEFPDKIRRLGLTVINLPPAFWRQVAEEWAGAPRAGEGHRLRLVILGGDAVLPSDLELWRRSPMHTARLLNAYGPTETTITATTFAAPRERAGDLSRVPIGQPLANRTAYVLDEHLQPVPLSVPGELYLGGPCLARGYLDRPGTTAESFIPHPFSSTPGARLYRTGDLVRWAADGQLEFLGRADHQVKIRGFRIELGEIEATLLAHPSVRQAAVLVREDTPGDRRLVAYAAVPAAAGQRPSSTELRQFLKSKLPDYMVPASLSVLDALPLTAGGKIDRRALADLSLPGHASNGSASRPRTPVEEQLAQICAALLGVGRVGLHDNFFDLGGHSLLATQLVSRIRKAFATEISLRQMFEAPTVAALAQRVESLRGTTRGRLAPPVVPVPRTGTLPLSFAQEALWFLDQLTPGLPTFNVTLAARIEGPLDPGALERALNAVVKRHEALRTRFALDGERPVQVVEPHVELRLSQVDLSSLPADTRLEAAGRLAAEEARRPFDMRQAPLVRASLLALGPEDHAALLTMHHIVTDGWSFGLAVRELAELYEAFRSGTTAHLPELPVQYADYALWQRAWLQGDVLEDLLAFWKGRLEGVPALELPTDRPRPAVRSQRGAVRSFALPAELSRAVREFSLREGATPFMTLMAAFQALLYRYSGQTDFAVGSPIANRTRDEVEHLIGYFINMVPIRADVSGAPSFRGLLDRVRQAALEAYEHQELPFELLVDALQPERDPSRTPIFQAMFVLQNTPLPDVGRSDLKFSALAGTEGTGTAKFDLSLGMAETPEGFDASLEYSLDLFDEATIARMAHHFVRLLEQVTAQPDRPIDALPIVSEHERRLVVYDWNQTGAEQSDGCCVPRLIEAQAQRTPDRVAVRCGRQSLTYRELNGRANQLARRLRERGVAPDARVGLAVDRSLEMAVGLLGIWKAGGAFVPLDPEYPHERLALMLREADVSVLVTQAELRERFENHVGPVVCLDSDGEAIASQSAEDLVDGPSPENLAYLLFTSGSTGEPRGVLVPHRGLANHALAAAHLFGLGPEDRVLQFCSLSFDIAMEELFPAWISGAEVVLRDDEFLDPAQFSGKLSQERITVVDLPTAFWHSWTSVLKQTNEPLPESLRLVVVGGEEASPALFETWRQRSGARVRWLNTYGPTEATIIATAWEAPAPDRTLESARMPIGRPIRNVQAYVLDAQLEPVPLGVAGELYLGGVGIARGYLNRPALTAERFLPDALSGLPGARMYRTGDRARWRADGTIEFLGRVDDQVKLRGFRVEPGEVEAALVQAEGVRDVAVVVDGDGSAPRRLVAYVVPADSHQASAEALRRFLKGKLPRYMMPSAFVMLDALPLTSSGKVDRRALPVPDSSVLDRSAEYVPPRTALEQSLARLWSEVLGIERIGALDNFFDLGGHSLQTVQLVARIRSELSQTVSIKDVFLAPTLAALAELLEHAPAAPAVERRPVRETEPMVAHEHLSIEERPLLPLFLAGELELVDSVAVGYLPSSLLVDTGLPPEVVIHELCRNQPILTGVRETRQGRIAGILIPRFDYQLYQDQADVLAVLGEALRMAGQAGARTASLTGLLPSATDYGRALAGSLAGQNLPAVTTGHATTTAAVVMNIHGALERSGRLLAEERVGFIGLGSVGIATLRLLLSCSPHPAELILCDVYQKQNELEAIRNELRDRLGYRGRVRLVTSGQNLPHEIYEASLIIGATNVPDILDVGRVRPGTILVDDSAPHVFASDAALGRFQERHDLLMTEGGVLAAPGPLPTLVHVPSWLESEMRNDLLTLVLRDDPQLITGCVLSGLLAARFDHLPPTLGFIDAPTALLHYRALRKLGYSAPPLHLGDTKLDEGRVRQFGERFGSHGAAAPRCTAALVPVQPHGSRVPLHFVHPIGGHVICYRELAEHLGEDQPFFAFEADGLDGASPPETDVERMAGRYIERLRAAQPEGPYVLGGWSFGGVVAFEMARQLGEQGQQIGALVLIDCQARARGAMARGEAEILTAFAKHLARSAGQPSSAALQPVQHLEDLDPALVGHLTPDHVRGLYEAFRAHWHALADYTPRRYAGRLILIRAGEAGAAGCADQTLGWSNVAAGGVSLHFVPGDHDSIMRRPGVGQVARWIRVELGSEPHLT